MDWSALSELIAGVRDIGVNPGLLLMMAIGGVLIYLGIAKKYEPLLLIPIGTGIILANLPLAELTRPATEAEAGGLLWYWGIAHGSHPWL